MSHQTQGSGGHPAGKGDVDLGFGGLSANVGDHIGHFYRTQPEATRTLASYFAAGLHAGEKCTLFSRPEVGEMVLGTLQEQGVEIDDAVSKGQFTLYEGPPRTAEAALEFFSELILETEAAGYHLIRHAGDMAWGLTSLPSTDELVKWEAMYDLHVASRFPLVALCQYDLSVFGGDVVLDALKTHPLCVIGEMIHKNPFFVPPQVFLEELATRPARGAR